MIITIDGPVASGKSTIGKLLAQKIGAYYLYTGLLYRGLAYLLIHHYRYTLDSIGNPRLHDVHVLLNPARFIYRYSEHYGEQIVFDGTDITLLIKNPLIDQAASIVSGHHEVREELNKIQRTIAQESRIVIDGRDAGSVVFSHAEYKFFLTADPKERAYRWQLQQARRGNVLSFEQALSSIRTRDERDSQRCYAPLIIPQGAAVIDTTALNVEQVVQSMMGSLHDTTLSQ